MGSWLKKKRTKHIFCCLAAVILVAAVSGFVGYVCGKNNSGNTTVETPYGSLYYPDKWAKKISIETAEEPWYTVSYYAKLAGKKIQLFDISFSNEAETTVGVIRTPDGGEVYLSVTTYSAENPPNLSEEEHEILTEMMDGLNNILEHLDFVDTSEEAPQPSETQPQTYDDLLIQTPYAQLRYPGKWQQWLEMETAQDDDRYTVRFYGCPDGVEKTQLFDVVFSEQGEMG